MNSDELKNEREKEALGKKEIYWKAKSDECETKIKEFKKITINDEKNTKYECVRDSTYSCSKQRAFPYSGDIIQARERAAPLGALHALHVSSCPPLQLLSRRPRVPRCAERPQFTSDGRESSNHLVRPEARRRF